ncbi:MAG TPA: hypothetical protein PKE65_10210, partial [Rhizobiaceae bacterium]|nr:hypothetical protein [Rhizobiaceae bacterium]
MPVNPGGGPSLPLGPFVDFFTRTRGAARDLPNQEFLPTKSGRRRNPFYTGATGPTNPRGPIRPTPPGPGERFEQRPPRTPASPAGPTVADQVGPFMPG